MNPGVHLLLRKYWSYTHFALQILLRSWSLSTRLLGMRVLTFLYELVDSTDDT